KSPNSTPAPGKGTTRRALDSETQRDGRIGRQRQELGGGAVPNRDLQEAEAAEQGERLPVRSVAVGLEEADDSPAGDLERKLSPSLRLQGFELALPEIQDHVSEPIHGQDAERDPTLRGPGRRGNWKWNPPFRGGTEVGRRRASGHPGGDRGE